MKRIILFRFHDHFDICENRLYLLKKLNPEIQIFGMYGGEPDKADEAESKLNKLDGIYYIKNKGKRWKWANGDLAMRQWYIDIGRKIPFDILHLIEWDLLLLSPIDKIYQKIPANGVGLTRLRPVDDYLFKLLEIKGDELKYIQKIYSYIQNPAPKEKISIDEIRRSGFFDQTTNEFFELLLYVKDKFNYANQYYSCIFPGSAFCRKFLERYSQTEIPELAIDEVRVSIFSKIFGIDMYDNGFFNQGIDRREHIFFNVTKVEILKEIIQFELNKSNGRRVFHPYYGIFNI